MTLARFVKAFIAGMAFPAFFLPFAYTVLFCIGMGAIYTKPFQFIPLYVPLLFGITNVIYVWLGDRYPIRSVNGRLWLTGACLGLIVALFGVFLFRVPELLFGLTYGFEYLPIILLPIIYGAVFRYIIKWINFVISV